MSSKSLLDFPISQRVIVELASNSADPLAVLGSELDILWANEPFLDLLAISRTRLLDNLHPDDTHGLTAYLEDPVEGYVNFRARVRDASGWLKVEFSVVNDGARYFVLCHTSLGHREREVRLKRQVWLMELAVRYASLGHWHVDLVEREIHWSPVVYEIHGVDPNEFQPDFDAALKFFAPDDRARLLRLWDKAIEEKSGYELEADLVRSNGETIRVFTKGRVGLGRDGEAVEIFGIFQDITARERENRRRAHTDRLSALGTLAAGLAHEINNPLAFMTANLDYVLDLLKQAQSSGAGFDEIGEAVDALEDALSGSERVASIVSSLRTFGASPSSEPLQFDLVLALRDAIEARPSDTGIRYLTNFSVPQASVVGDGAVIDRVFDEVLENAERAVASITDREPQIGVYLAQNGDAFSIEIVDNGVGMTPEVLEQAFEPFFSTREVDQGKGLGLSTCLGIIASLGGSLELHSRVGVGTTVSMTLPNACDSVSNDGLDIIENGPDEVRRELVYLVDDEPLVGRAIKRTLGNFFEVELYSSADDALGAIEDGARPIAIVCDIMMPGRTGLELYQAVEQAIPELADAFIFLSGGLFSPAMEATLEKIGAPRVSKPFVPDELRSVVKEVAERQRKP